MTYRVKEVFKTLQGEGHHAGRAAVFCRFSGCNLWSGREEDRSSAICQFCDTQFIGGREHTTSNLALLIAETWGRGRENRIVVFTGGEPLLQLDTDLIEAVKAFGFAVHVETNGTIRAPKGIQWLTVSPKAGASLKADEADELKIVFPQDGIDPEEVRRRLPATFCSLQPMDGPGVRENAAQAVDYVKAHPWWRLSVQTHKAIGIP